MYTSISKALFFCLLCVGLTACQPKGTWLYQAAADERPDWEHIVVIIDYLNLKDDLDGHWDFASEQHQMVLNRLLAETNRTLQQSGYPRVNRFVLSSGLLFAQPMAVDHYRNSELQHEPLYPPYLLAVDGMEHIAVHQEVLQLLVKYTAPRRHHPEQPDSLRGMHVGHQFDALQLPEDLAVLYIHIDQSAPGIIKQLSSLLLAAAVSSQSDYTQVYLDGGQQKQASAFLVHGSGQIIWKNHDINWHPGQPINQLLIDFPVIPVQPGSGKERY
ncbi:hypothetical protein ACFODZ_02265 [Marinicella sediminis]|uniref:Lipoprotein n=1 Tax=Marinicella sediminis TaxID=1792834 RepID=A0ABV7JAD7_9GAMM|nr:hypothetical protein [Marinicella sediminis]